MRLTCAIACGLVAYDCFEMATGQAPQHLLATSFIWVWSIVAGLWIISALNVLLNGAK